MPDSGATDVLLVDDEPHVLNSASTFLRSSGISKVQTLQDARQLLSVVGRLEVGVVVLDLAMPHVTGKQLLAELAANHPDIPVIVMTATNELDTAVACMQAGAIDYLVKPIEGDRLFAAVRRGLEIRSLRSEVYSLRKSMLGQEPSHPDAFKAIVTQDRSMFTLFRYVEAIAKSPQPVLITGESGTGKELFANALHSLSGRNGKLVAINVAGLDDPLFSDTLFGHTKGSFTGAERAREGVVASAANGTLFLDEIGDLSTASQVKLLRLIQDGTYYPVGSDHAQRSQARIVVATNSHVVQDIDSGKFRKDLYFRLRTHQIELPPLRQRPGDIPLLLQHFVTLAGQSLGKSTPRIPENLCETLQKYAWPGNVRELEGMCFDAVARLDGSNFSAESFKPSLSGRTDSKISAMQADQQLNWPSNFLPTLDDAEDALIAEALARAGGNQTTAAEFLGISRQALNKRLSRRKNL